MQPSAIPSCLSNAAGVRIAIVIPALHRPDLTARAIAGVLRQELAPEAYEIIVVENAAHDGPTLPDPLAPRVRRVLLSKNLGFAGGVNAGIAASSSEYVLILNNDVELRPDCLKLLLAAMEAAPHVALAGGKLLNAADPALLDGAGDALLLGGGAYRLGHGDRDEGQFDSARPPAVCGAALLARRDALNELGGLDDDFFAYLDDLDLALRARRRGYEVLYVPQAVALHAGSATLGAPLHPKAMEWITRNQVLVVIKNYPSRLLLRLAPRIIFFQALWMARAVRQRLLGPYLRGILGALWLLPAILRKRRGIQRSATLPSSQFAGCLRASEALVAGWQRGLAPQQRSRLLTAYFKLFKPSQT